MGGSWLGVLVAVVGVWVAVCGVAGRAFGGGRLVEACRLVVAWARDPGGFVELGAGVGEHDDVGGALVVVGAGVGAGGGLAGLCELG
jgi:hypothetical protein